MLMGAINVKRVIISPILKLYEDRPRRGIATRARKERSTKGSERGGVEVEEEGEEDKGGKRRRGVMECRGCRRESRREKKEGRRR